ncbi:hypothetical protein GIS00_20170 [Nakamurella sp. YIM 132087]|uniref:YdeI/OmpD-associated family protein n=1 Tax=Nakamurella alba TaxID=2665158 RepID=A0A7K1FSA8_9ACTN|nr:YdeI/OmpD-associated family protein [Nakamurella alba]MTD16259.1 hypothetical protein [Nakamurella alba]
MITTTGVAVPEDMAAALSADPEALTAFEAMRPAEQREYVDWLAQRDNRDRAQRLTELAGHVRNHRSRPAPED